MRCLALLGLLACLAVPAGALALEQGADDGTLSLDGVTGSVSFAARGAIIGQIDKGSVTISDPNPNDGKPPVVWGYERKRDLTDTKFFFSGSGIRFRVVGGFFRVKVVGSGVDISMVGRGSVSLGPAPALLSAGSFSLNGSQPLPFPDFPLTFQLDAAVGG